jgi:hypothetical protein
VLINCSSLRLACGTNFVDSDLNSALLATSIACAEKTSTHAVIPTSNGEVIRLARERERGDGVGGWLGDFNILVATGRGYCGDGGGVVAGEKGHCGRQQTAGPPQAKHKSESTVATQLQGLSRFFTHILLLSLVSVPPPPPSPFLAQLLPERAFPARRVLVASWLLLTSPHHRLRSLEVRYLLWARTTASGPGSIPGEAHSLLFFPFDHKGGGDIRHYASS